MRKPRGHLATYWSQAAMLALAAAMFAGSSGCISMAGPPPTMPNYATPQGRVCGRSCQESYNACLGACTAAAPIDRAACGRNCNLVLGDCYRSCE